MGLFSRNTNKLNWTPLTSTEELDAIFKSDEAQLIFKHSTRCGISSMALSQFEREWDENAPCKIYMLDLLNYRSISNEIATLSGITHQSPQVIVVKNGTVIYSDSHSGIDAKTIQSKF